MTRSARLGAGLAGLLLAAGALAGGVVAPASAAAPTTAATLASTIPTSHTATPTPLVGPLFVGNASGDHFCTASVLDSSSRDLILTAAHCISGTAVGVVFAPGYDRGRTPYGVWSVTAAFVAPRWLTALDIRYDYAILRVAPDHGRRIEDVTGGLRLSVAPAAGTKINDVAYNAGRNDRPIACTVPVRYRGVYPTFSCHGYVGGSSGSPWLVPAGRSPSAVVGVIGGLHQGGCFEFTSYTSPFNVTATQVLARAASGASSDLVPTAGGDGC